MKRAHSKRGGGAQASAGNGRITRAREQQQQQQQQQHWTDISKIKTSPVTKRTASFASADSSSSSSSNSSGGGGTAEGDSITAVLASGEASARPEGFEIGAGVGAENGTSAGITASIAAHVAAHVSSTASPTSPSSPSSLQPPRKRKRRVVSCAECHRRKQKCDRNQPCRACIDRKMESSCHYETPAMSRERHHLRVIEAATYGRALQAGGSLPVKAAGFGYVQTSSSTMDFLSKIDAGARAARAVMAGGEEPPGEAEGAGGGVQAPGSDSTETALLHLSSSFMPSSATTAEAAAALAAQQYYQHYGKTHDEPLAHAQEQQPQQQPHFHPQQQPQQQPHFHPQQPQQQPQQHHQRHQQQKPANDHYGTADRYKALIRELPPRPYIDRLLEIYFCEFNWQYDMLEEDVFYKQLSDWSDVATGPFGAFQAPHQLSPDLRAFPALLLQVLATALLALPPGEPDAFFSAIRHPSNLTMEDLAMDYSESSMSVLALLGKRQMSLTGVLAGFMRGSFLKYVGLITEAWHAIGSAIRDAQEIGLHRDSMDPKPWAQTAEAVLENAWEIQRRRRLWMKLSSWDLQMAVVLGRPTTIDQSQQQATLPVDCLLPTSVAERATLPVTPRGPDDPPTALSCQIWYYQTVLPLRTVLELEREGPCPRSFARVDALHAEMVAVQARLPAEFRLENPDRRFDDRPGCVFLPRVRIVLPQATVFNFMALHRLYLFTRAHSRHEALRACLAMLQMQRVHFATLPPEQYRSFLVFFGTFDPLVLMATIYILFPREHPELLPDVIQHFRWSVERFEVMMHSYTLARSALGVLQAIYVRLRKALGIRFLEGEGCGGTAAVDALTLSNIDPSLQDAGTAVQAAARSGGPDSCSAGSTGAHYDTPPTGPPSVGSGSVKGQAETGGAAAEVEATETGSATAVEATETGRAAAVEATETGSATAVEATETGRAAAEVEATETPEGIELFDGSLLPCHFDWATLPPICPTGDLAYNVLMGVTDGSGGGGGGNMGMDMGMGMGLNLGLDVGTNMGAGMDLGMGMGMAGGGLNMAYGLGMDMEDAAAAAAAAATTTAVLVDPKLAGNGAEAAGAATETAAAAEAVEAANGSQGPQVATINGAVVPWQFEGGFNSNSLWGLLNSVTPF